MKPPIRISVSENVSVSDEATVVRNGKFNRAYTIGEFPEIYIRQKPYILSFAKYLILKSDDIRSKLIKVAYLIFGPTVGLGLTLLAKLPRNLPDIKHWECIAFAVGLASSIALFCIGRKKPNPKKDLLLNMEKHFRENEEHLWMDQKNE